MSMERGGKGYAKALSLLYSLFFLWAIGVHLNDILIPHFKMQFHLTDFKSSLTQFFFFGGYFLAAIPAARVIQARGYRNGIIAGLTTCAAGAALFIPAAYASSYAIFLCGLFVLACGQSFLEVAANPYVALLGPPRSSAFRLNVGQAVNALGAVSTPILGALLILGPAERAARAGDYTAESTIIVLPYAGLILVYLLYAAIVSRAHLPEVQQDLESEVPTSARSRYRSLLKRPQFVLGVMAQFFYVGAQVGVASFVIRLVEHLSHGTIPDSVAATYLRYHLIGFLCGRILGAVLLRKIAPARVLFSFAFIAVLAGAAVVGGTGELPIWSVVLLGACNSIMFPTIFALSLSGLGENTKVGSSVLVMSIVGGALLPPVMGWLSDRTDIQYAFSVPVIAYLVVLAFAVVSDRTERRLVTLEDPAAADSARGR